METKRIPYEFNLTCGHEAMVEVDARTMTPLDPETGKPDIVQVRGRAYVTYTCPECGTKETP